ncbi:MAG: putative lipid II flippase FtsW [Firmicutes bacterium]|jgi:cell division protein FtsW|nr:putative lipid II flippase FtsW [Bacillota bacterium]HPU01355.1 putative lipid II flippase FtsW [Bacillota bacterium]
MKKEQLHDPDYALILVIFLLLGIGLVMVFSASYIIAEESYGDPYYFLRRQVLWVLLGLAAMYLVSRVNYWKLRRLSLFLLLLSFFLLGLVYTGLGTDLGTGARRWLDFGAFTFQPAELSKLALVLFAAAFMSSRSIRMERFWSSSFVPLLLAGLSFALVVSQPDLGSALILLAGTGVIVLLAGMPFKQVLGLALISVPALVAVTIKKPYRLQRLLSFADPWADPTGSGYHIIQSLYALGPGHLFGVGLGRSRQKLYYLPFPHNDFIFAVIGEELGFVGATAVLLLFFVLVWRGLKIALTAPDTFGCLLAAGITATLALQVIINVGMVTGTLPVTGINLPLISAGGSSVFFNLLSLGILLNISRHCHR